MFELIFAIILAAGTLLGVAVVLRALASMKNPIFAVFIPAQTHALVTTKSSDDPDSTKGGSNVVDVLHSNPGKMLNKSPASNMDWFYEPGEETRSLLYKVLGIQLIWFFRYLRLNDVRTFRWGRKDDQSEYSMLPKSNLTRYVHFSGQHDVDIKGIETIGILKIDLRFNVIYEEKYPVRVRLRTADPYAVLTVMMNQRVISNVGGKDPKALIANEHGEQESLTKAIMGISSDIEEDIGIEIKKVTLANVDFDEETKTLLEQKVKAELDAEAGLIKAKNDAAQEIERAQGERQGKILRNEGDAHRAEFVIKPLAENERTVQVAGYDAYRDNATMTTLVVGNGAIPTIPVGK